MSGSLPRKVSANDIAQPPLRFNEPALACPVDLLAQGAHAHFDNMVVDNPLVVPDLCENRPLADDASLMTEQVLKEVEFQFRQKDLPVASCHPSADGIECQRVEGKRFCLPRLAVAAEYGVDSCPELVCGERLREIVVGPGVKSADLGFDGVGDAQDDDGRLDLQSAGLLDDFDSIPLRKHDVDKGEPVPVGRELVESGVAVVGDVAAEAALREVVCGRMGLDFVVFDDERFHGDEYSAFQDIRQ